MKFKILLLAMIFVACKKDKEEKTVVRKQVVDPRGGGGYPGGYPGYPRPGYPVPGYPGGQIDYTLYCLRITSPSISAYNNAGSVFLNNVGMDAYTIPCTELNNPNANLYVGQGYLGDLVQLSLTLNGNHQLSGNINFSISGNLDMSKTMQYNAGRTSNHSNLCRYGVSSYTQTYNRPITRVFLNGRLTTGMSIYGYGGNTFKGTAIACDDAGGSVQVDLNSTIAQGNGSIYW